ncbi:hypothetical protein ACWD0G_09110, partial [Streptomyces goshikiensis]
CMAVSGGSVPAWAGSQIHAVRIVRDPLLPFATATTGRCGGGDERNRSAGRSGGLIGDVHGDATFLRDAVVTLASRGCTSLAQLGDFGMIWRGTRSEIQVLEALNKQLAPLGCWAAGLLGCWAAGLLGCWASVCTSCKATTRPTT